MSRKKLFKIIVFEVLQWIAFATPLFVIGTLSAQVLQDGQDYWLIVSLTIVFVAITTLLVWIPVKLCFHWLKLSKFGEGKWCYSMLLYVIFSFIPCVIMILVALPQHYDVTTFQYTSVELLIIMLLVIDWSEKLKHFKLRAEFQKNNQDNNMNEVTDYTYEGSISGYSLGRRSETNLVQNKNNSNKISTFFLWDDPRSSHLLYSLLNIYDVRMLLSVAVNSDKLGFSPSSWVNGIYVLGILAACTFVPAVNNQYSAMITTIFLDSLFFFFRLSLFCKFGKVTSILFLFKNLFVASSYIYFGLIRRLIYGENSPQTPQPVAINSISNGVIQNIEQGYNKRNYDPYELEGNDFDENGRNNRHEIPQGYNDNSRGYDDQHQDEYQQQQQGYATSSQQHYDDHNYVTETDNNNVHYYQDDNQGHHDNHDVTHGFNQWEEEGEFDDDVVDLPVTPQSGLKPVKRVRSQRATILQSNLYSSAKSQSPPTTTDPLPSTSSHVFAPPQNPPDSPPQDSHTQEPPQGDSTQEPTAKVLNEPTYSQVNKSTKKNKNPAPPPPSQSNNQQQDEQADENNQISSSNSNHEVARVSTFNHWVGPHKVSVRTGHSFTPDIASQIAQEARRRSQRNADAEDQSDSSSLDIRF